MKKYDCPNCDFSDDVFVLQKNGRTYIKCPECGRIVDVDERADINIKDVHKMDIPLEDSLETIAEKMIKDGIVRSD